MPTRRVRIDRFREKRRAMQWARRRIVALRAEKRNGEPVWPEKSIANQIIKEAEAIWNIGIARIIAKELKLEQTYETEAEVEDWERGERE